MLEKFHYPTPGGQIVLPHFKHIPAGVIRKHRKEPAVDQAFSIIEAVADADTLALIDALPSEQLNDLLTAWRDASQVTEGESPASSKS